MERLFEQVDTGLVLVNTAKTRGKLDISRVLHVGSAPKTVQDAYLEGLGKRKEDVNFKKQVICSKHWSCGKRLNLEDFPSITFTESGS